MPIYRNGIFRPLLIFSELEMQTIFKNEKWLVFEDESNESETYLRNRLRKNVIPTLKKEGLNANKVFANFHEKEEYLIEHSNTSRNIPSFLRIDDSSLGTMPTGQLKQLLDIYCSVLKLYPITKNLLLEIKKELSNKTSFLIENRELFFWKSNKSDLYLISKSSPTLEKAKVKSTSKVSEIHWNEKSKQILAGKQLGSFAKGLKIIKKKKHFEISELLREKHIPIPVREFIPILVNESEPVAILFSLWDDRFSDFIGDLYYEQS